MKRVYLAESLVDGQLVADWLNDNGIPCEIFHQNATGALGELPVTSPEVWVRRNPDAARARTMVEQVIFVDDQSEKICERCHESNPGSFEICWHCRNSLGE